MENMKKLNKKYFITITLISTKLLNPISLAVHTIWIQGVPRNMTLARRIESRLSTFKLLVTFSLHPSFTCMISETITSKFA